MIALLALGCVILTQDDLDEWRARHGDDTAAGWEAELFMVDVADGSYHLGSPNSEEGRRENEPERDVVLSRAWSIGALAVTQDQFSELLGYAPSTWSECGGDCPVESITWNEAAAFANAVSERAGLDACYECVGEGTTVECGPLMSPYDCPGYRLPTEAEWEASARAGEPAAFYNGGNLLSGTADDCEGDLELDNFEVLDEIAWYCGNASESPVSVGLRAPNAFGLYDMSGNTGDWCHDGWMDEPPDGEDPLGADGEYRAVRGGSAWDEPQYLRSAFRTAWPQNDRSDGLGMRLARTR